MKINVKSLLITTLVAFITLAVTNYLIHQVLLASSYAATKHFWRPAGEMPLVPWMVLGQFLVAASFTMIFVACVAEKKCQSCALKFATSMGVFSGGGHVIMYAVEPYPLTLVAKWFVAGLLQMVLLGFVVYKVYKLPAK